MDKLKQLHIGLSLSATWLKGDGWRDKDSRVEELFMGDFYVDLAKKAEKAKLDFVFKPDALFLDTKVLDSSPGWSSLDPTVLLTSIARETERIGLITTISSTFYPPYIVARQLQSLNWISNGRAGWNIVTSLGGVENFMAGEMPSSQERYAQAEEFHKVVNSLWDSFPGLSLLTNRKTGHYADHQKISTIDHVGEFFHVEGPLNIPSYQSHPLPLLQAGASPSGRAFASAIADAVFAAAPDITAAKELRNDLRAKAQQEGRSEDAIRILPGLYFFLADTREEAFKLHARAHANLSKEKRYETVQTILGLNLRDMPLDHKITADLLPNDDVSVRSQTHTNLLKNLITEKQPTIEELLSRPEVVGSGHWVIVGTVEDALVSIEEWVEADAMDGFIALPGGSLHSLELFCDKLVPMLVDKGLFRKDYSGNTLREHLLIDNQ
ncbi:NtaA/DmoA family FMN-dependent monooxygenase [Gracilibacillus suaedae]|uniref:NtaA/DmoA family FMN-dependent monooxygenase n=1 Tax=Gracilibacillus suaedae TaxID=2820273 RepID=UPI001ABDF450|nr:NtaA/DmoA family FMN-dependent monooxygenase [Gracilibacillus suaedae]